MKRMTLGLLTLALALTLGGCFKHTYTIGTGAPDGEIVYRHWHHHWLFGTIRPELQKKLDVEKLCPSGDATIHEEVSFVNGLIDALIGIIYSPTTVEVRCDSGRSASVELSGEDVAAIVNDPFFLEVVEVVAPERLAETRVAFERFEAPSEVALAP